MNNAFLYLILCILIVLLIIGISCFMLFLVYMALELIDDWKFASRKEGE
jgi:hypothetical protein